MCTITFKYPIIEISLGVVTKYLVEIKKHTDAPKCSLQSLLFFFLSAVELVRQSSDQTRYFSEKTLLLEILFSEFKY